MQILNLTQHVATKEQVEAGVFEPSKKDKEIIKQLLTFDTPPIYSTLLDRAIKLTKIVKTYQVKATMIGGAPFFMSMLETILNSHKITSLYSFTKRVVIENSDGTKTSTFKHESFIQATIL